MTRKFPGGPDDPFSDVLKHQRDQSELIKRALRPNLALQTMSRVPPSVFSALNAAEKSGILKTATMLQSSRLGDAMRVAEQLRMSRIPVLKDFASTSWLSAIQRTAIAINRDPTGILASQKLLLGSTVPDMLKLGTLFEANKSVIGKLVMGSAISAQFKALNEAIGQDLGILKTAAERARMLNIATLRATAGTVAASSTVLIAEQVLEAHRLIEAISQVEDPAQSVDLFSAFLAVMGAMFSAFGENTLKELRGIGAIKLLELFMLSVAIYQFAVPADIPPAEKKIHAEMQVEIETLNEKIDRLIAADEQANQAYVADYPRGELRRTAPIRRGPQGKAQVLMRGDMGMDVFLKESRGKWRLVVYRDPLTEQMSEGWVYAPAITLLNDTGA